VTGDAVIDGTALVTGVLTTTAATVFNGGFAAGGVGTFADGSAGAPSITNTGDTNTGIFFPAADTIAFAEGGAEAARFDSTGRLLIGSTASQENNHRLQITGGDQATSSISVSRLSADQFGAHIEYLGTRSTSVGSNTIVQDDDTLGLLIFRGDDGTNFATEASSIRGEVDGTPGENDMPGRLTFFTTADGAATGTERLRIDKDGNVFVGGTSYEGSTTSNASSLAILSTGFISANVTDDFGMQVNRTGDNGKLLNFRKNGADVGSIGYQNTGFVIDGEAGHAGLRFAGNEISPRDNGSDVDNTVDLGESDKRFKDAYIAGNVIISGSGKGINFAEPTAQSGGTSQILDSYEEGTWTPVMKDSSANQVIATTSTTANYTKIGRLVWVNVETTRNTSSTFSGTLTLTGLPFSTSAKASYSANNGTAWFDGTGTDDVTTIHAGRTTTTAFFKKVGEESSFLGSEEFQNARPFYASFWYMSTDGD